ncbi:UNVERIFIED_CONTAM: hypothetical protein K2H54_042891 [Gekko kuhli]
MTSLPEKAQKQQGLASLAHLTPQHRLMVEVGPVLAIAAIVLWLLPAECSEEQAQAQAEHQWQEPYLSPWQRKRWQRGELEECCFVISGEARAGRCQSAERVKLVVAPGVSRM